MERMGVVTLMAGLLAATACGSKEPDCSKVAEHLEKVAANLGEDNTADIRKQVAGDCKDEAWPADVRKCMVEVEDVAGFDTCLKKHPAFPLARAKNSEARELIKKLYDGARAYYMAPGVGAGASIGMAAVAAQFPGESVGPTPALGECCKQGGKCAPDVANWEAMTWVALQFSVDDPHQYSYQYEVTDPSKKFTVRAFGDLDCDGKYSTFEMTGEINAAHPDGPQSQPDIVEVDPLE